MSQRNPKEIWYFAYGSNLYVPQMQARIGKWKASKKAHLKGWKLVFTVYSNEWGGGAANIIKTDKPHDVVYGALYLLSRKQLKTLTTYEGKPPQDITVESEGKEINAKAYVFDENRPPLKPAPLYMETIVCGLKQHSYEKEEIETVLAYAMRNVRFHLFSKRSFEVSHPVSLIEAYCFQSNFYANYDLLLQKRNRKVEDVNKIGARIKRKLLTRCKAVLKRYKDPSISRLDLDGFLKLDDNVRKKHIQELSAIVEELVAIKGIRLSKATKILHTVHPQIIPIFDTNLQKIYQKLKPQWKYGDWNQMFMDYYDNFLVKDTYHNLCNVHDSISYLALTKVRVFDILWWSYLKAERLREEQNVNWTTIV